jgi:hypothetical protein
MRTMRVVALVSVAIGWPMSRSAEGQQEVFRSAVDVVSVDVAVMRRNAPISGLTASDFQLRDNGVQQHIEVLANRDVPVDVTLVFDESAFNHRIRQGLKGDLTRMAAMLRPVDRLRVLATSASVREICAMGPPSLVPALDLSGRNSLDAAGDTDINDLYHDPRLRPGAFTDGLLLALTSPPLLGRRHLVVGFAPPADNSVLDSEMLVSAAKRSEALLHVVSPSPSKVVSPQGTIASVMDIPGYRVLLARAAVATGGAGHDFDDGVKGFKSVFADFTQAYVLRYTLQGVPRSGWHSVEITAPGLPDCTIRARSGYFGE